LQENDQTNDDPDNAKKPDGNPFRAAHSLFKLLPVWLRRIIIGALTIFVVLVLVSIFKPYMNERIRFLTDSTLNLLIVLIVAVQAYIYRRQWEAMRDTLKEMRISRELENRAWIGVTAIDLEDAKSGGVEVVATFVNGGNSPAIVKMEYRMEVLEQSPPDDVSLGSFPDEGSTLAFFPNTERKSQLGLLPGVPMPAKPKSPSHTYYVYGSLRYEDVFQQRHITRFCYKADRVELKGKVVAVLAVARTHNTFD
jgi:hypothetical protein